MTAGVFVQAPIPSISMYYKIVDGKLSAVRTEVV